MTTLLISVALAVVISAFCSMSEAALYSVPWSWIERLRKDGRPSGELLFALRSNVEKPITAILTLNTIANTAGAAVAGAAGAAVFGTEDLWLFTAAFTLVILAFGEILPKTVGVAYNRPVSVFIAAPMIIWGSRPLPFPKQALPVFFGEPALTFADVTITWMQMSIYIVALTLMIGLNCIITKTRVGTAMRALAQNQTAAALMGINVNRVISFTFALGSGMGAVAGIMVSMYYNTMYPTMGYLAGVKAFAAAVLGGIGSVPGAMLGGVVLGIAETLGAGYLSSPYRDGVAYAVMILVIIFRPSGLLGRAMVEKA